MLIFYFVLRPISTSIALLHQSTQLPSAPLSIFLYLHLQKHIFSCCDHALKKVYYFERDSKRNIVAKASVTLYRYTPPATAPSTSRKGMIPRRGPSASSEMTAPRARSCSLLDASRRVRPIVLWVLGVHPCRHHARARVWASRPAA